MTDTHTLAQIDDPADRKRIVNRLRRLEGQVRGLQAMVESGKECESVLTQIMAVKSALNQVGMHVIGHAMKKCLIDDDIVDRDELVSAAFGVYLRYRQLVSANQSPLPAGGGSPEKLVGLLKRLESEIAAVEATMEGGADCERALTDLTMATATLNTVALSVLGHSMQSCMVDESAKSREEIIDSAIAVFLRYSSCVS